MRASRFLLAAAFTALSIAAFTPATAQVDTSTVHVSAVLVLGNKVTRERVVLRELTFREGDTLAREGLVNAVRRSTENLLNTGLFNTVQLVPVPIGPAEVVVQVHLNERWYLWPAPILEVGGDPNFNTWWLTRDLGRLNWGGYLYRYNARGMNETAYVLAQFGYTQRFAAKYRVPFLDRSGRWSLAAGGGYHQQREITVGTADNERIFFRPAEGHARTEWNIEVELGLRRAHDVRHAFRVGYRDARVIDTVAWRFPDHFNDGAQRMAFLTFGYTVIRDRRDSRVFPRTGSYAELRADRHGLGGADAPDNTVLYATVKEWWTPADRWTLAIGLRGRSTLGPPIPYYLQEGLGYTHYVRGYEYYVIDGQHFALGRFNALFTLLRPRIQRLRFMPLEAFRTLHLALYLNAFVDGGRVWDDRYADANPLANTWMSGAGLGLDLVTSYDQVLRAEGAVNGRGELGFFLHFTQPF